MEEFLKQFADYTALVVETIAVVLIAYGAAEAFVASTRPILKEARPGWRKAIWVRLGMWLLLGLQFALGADIVRSVISPTWNDIGQLAAIAVIRTFLNFFLEKDLSEAERAGGATLASKEVQG